jgi:Ner family transcriptional regulator
MYIDNSTLNMTKKPAPKDWPRWRIIGAVRDTGTSLQQLSLSMNYTRSVLISALYRPCPKYERLIAEYLGVTAQIIWPSRYHTDGTPRSGRGERGLGRYKPKQGNGSTVKKTRNVYMVNNKTEMEKA